MKYIKFKKFNNSLKHRLYGGVFLYSTNTPKNKPHFDLKNQSAVCF
ncbi:L-asparaginase II [Aggregatibacter segnis ATCC 33393]|uniref:L-asparaginase II n=1 Tax=Aggregatibacter segnis ATCC 33393 TaxID=888057 RepID=E6KWP8_9PAST|nr:L-asparaginase II [Aggregatibacter segnis ATCC 33393]